MEKVSVPSVAQEKFSSPEEELDFLRKEVTRKESELQQKLEGVSIPAGHAEKEVIQEYKAREPENTIHEKYRIPEVQLHETSLDLAPEQHDAKISELLVMLHKNGVMNTLSVIKKMKDPHLEDDFERFLAQYIKKGFPAWAEKESGPIFKGLRMTLYEVNLPQNSDQQKDFKELISAMEQFYSGMLSVEDEKSRTAQYFTIELAVENHSNEFVFYAAVPDDKKALFEKHILSLFHDAKISEHKDDYNIFNESGVSIGSYALSAGNPIFPIKTYDTFERDPLGVILNSFSQVDRDGEGAAIQVVFSPAGDEYVKKYSHALDLVKKGYDAKDVIEVPDTIGGHLFQAFKSVGKAHFRDEKKETKESEARSKANERTAEQIAIKVSSPIVKTNIRIIASSHTEAGAAQILSHIESAFNQFENTSGNKFRFVRPRGGALGEFLDFFTFRLFRNDDRIPLNLKEITTVMHFPTSTLATAAPQLKISKSGSAPAPLDLPTEGLILGVNNFRNVLTNVRISAEDRLRHMYVIGQTGTGKTTLLKNMIIQDIAAGRGVCMIDPHGADIEDVLASIPPERSEDLIYFDPGYTSRPMGLNMLEYDTRYPEQKTFVVNEMLSIFNKLFDMKTAGGPMFEQYFRNATMLVIDDPDSGNTLLEISRVLAQKSFRELKLSRCKNPLVVQFWKEVAEKAGGEASLANMVPYITSKFDVFLSNEIMRPIIAQEKSSFNFREVMDQKKILLINLAKGRLGDINSNLIGLICVGKILMAALSRVDSLGSSPPPFYLYIDEFQNVTTDSIATILSEARKYGLSLTVAHQFIAQLDEKIKNSVFGNIGSIASFRVGADDAEYLEKQFAPVFGVKDLINLENYNACLKLLVRGIPAKPFNLTTIPPQQRNREIVEKLKEFSYFKYGRNREEVESEIMGKYGGKAT